MDDSHQAGAWPSPTAEQPHGLKRPALLLASSALLISITVGFLAFLSSRNAVYESVYNSRLRLARTFAALYEEETLSDQESQEAALASLQKLWASTEKRFKASYLCVQNSRTEVVLSTDRDCGGAGTDGNIHLEEAGEGPATLAELLDAGRDWVGQTRSLSDKSRVSAFANCRGMRGLVGLHVPTSDVDAEVLAVALPWAVGLSALTLVLLLMGAAVLQWQHTVSMRALRHSRLTLATLMSNLPGMVYRCRNDRDWTMEFVSEGAEALTGYQPADLIGSRALPYSQLILPEDRENTWKEVQDALSEKQPFQLSYRIHTRAGEVKHVWEKGCGLFDAKGDLVVLEGFVTDVTEQRHLEDQLRQAQKMEAVGQLAGGIAHDFNNVLMVIKGYSELLTDKLKGHDRLGAMAGEIQKASERAAGLVRQLLAFSRKQVLDPQVLDLNAIVASTEMMLQRLIGEDIVLATALSPTLGHVKADPGQIEQVIMNLAVNARDAMPEGGKLTIETQAVELDETYAQQKLGARPGSYALLAVTDTGQGMDKETQSHIFEPFFTTKEKGKGTGLGLATVYGIVKQSGGYVWVYSEPGQGTTFKVYLPRIAEAEQAAVLPAPRAETSAASREALTVLIVEDEASLRALEREYLEVSGFKVLEAESGEEAILVCEQHDGPISLLMTDVVMPGLSGRALAEQISARRPGIKVLYVSGYPDQTIARHGVLETEMHFLQKPFSAESLRRKLNQIFRS